MARQKSTPIENAFHERLKQDHPEIASLKNESKNTRKPPTADLEFPMPKRNIGFQVIRKKDGTIITKTIDDNNT